jgi:hypothetical protein
MKEHEIYIMTLFFEGRKETISEIFCEKCPQLFLVNEK